MLRWLIRRFDAFLSWVLGVYTFSSDAECLLRLQQTRTARRRILPGFVVEPGELVLMLHLWNERLPPIPPSGPNLVWANRLCRKIILSLRLVANYLHQHPELSHLRVIGGVTVLFSLEKHKGGFNFIEGLGFTILPYHNPLGRFGEFWENFYTWWLMWTYNIETLQYRRLLALKRSEFWMPVDEYLSRFGNSEITPR